MPALIGRNGMRFTCFLESLFSPEPANVVLKGVIFILYTIIAIFVKLKLAFKAFLG